MTPIAPTPLTSCAAPLRQIIWRRRPISRVDARGGSMLRKIASAVVILLSLISAARAAANIDPEALGKLDITTFPAEKREEAHKMLGRDASERLKEANRRESAAWAEL